MEQVDAGPLRAPRNIGEWLQIRGYSVTEVPVLKPEITCGLSLGIAKPSKLHTLALNGLNTQLEVGLKALLGPPI